MTILELFVRYFDCYDDNFYFHDVTRSFLATKLAKDMFTNASFKSKLLAGFLHVMVVSDTLAFSSFLAC